MKVKIILFAFLQIFMLSAYSQEPPNYYASDMNNKEIPSDVPTILKGKKAFNQHCSSCHTLCNQRIGPALASVTDRRPVSWLLAFVNSSQQVISSGDQYANFLFEKYNHTIMPDFTYLSEDDILTILAYIDDASAAPYNVAGTNGQINNQNKSIEKTPKLESSVRNIDYSHKIEKHKSWSKFFKWALIGFTVIAATFHISYVYYLWRKGKEDKSYLS